MFRKPNHKRLEKENTPYKIYAELIDDNTEEQFLEVLSQDYITYAALMPDTHSGYTMPIGGVASCKNKIVPQFVGFDIGCGMCALKTKHKKEDIENNAKRIYSLIRERIALGFNRNKTKSEWNHNLKITDFGKEILNESLDQLGTLGGGNHFIEIGYDEEDTIWIVIHSGSRGFGHKIASHYMKKAYLSNISLDIEIDKQVQAFEERNKNFKKSKPDKYKKVLEEFKEKARNKTISKLSISKIDNIKGVHPLDVNSKDGQDYIIDQNFGLEFALENRKRMIKTVHDILNEVSGVNFDFDTSKEEIFINRNHNHAEFNVERGEWIHRKGATHAEKGMYGVIPGNMRDGSFIVKGKGNPESLNSSSHGAGRVMSRSKAKEKVSLEDFKSSMNGITGTVNEGTIDESPFAYKDIFEVMKQQEDLVKIIAHVRPLINVKDSKK
jgi:tRNA-splicing ligase RtcB